MLFWMVADFIKKLNPRIIIFTIVLVHNVPITNLKYINYAGCNQKIKV